MFKLLFSFIPGVGPFLSAFDDLLLKHWKLIVICLMIGTIAYQNFSPTRYFFWADTIPYLVAENKTLTNELLVAANANKNLTNDITGLNSVVNDWEAKSKDLAAQNAALQGKLDQMSIDNKKKVQSILNDPTPKNCPDSLSFLRDQQKQLTWGVQ